MITTIYRKICSCPLCNKGTATIWRDCVGGLFCGCDNLDCEMHASEEYDDGYFYFDIAIIDYIADWIEYKHEYPDEHERDEMVESKHIEDMAYKSDYIASINDACSQIKHRGLMD